MLSQRIYKFSCSRTVIEKLNYLKYIERNWHFKILFQLKTLWKNKITILLYVLKENQLSLYTFQEYINIKVIHQFLVIFMIFKNRICFLIFLFYNLNLINTFSSKYCTLICDHCFEFDLEKHWNNSKHLLRAFIIG